MWFGSSSTIVLLFFSLSFNYFLDESINSSIKAKMQKGLQNIEFAVVKENKIIEQSKNFTLNNFKDYLNQESDFFIIKHKHDDDYIDALYITQEKESLLLLYKTNIDNKIEEFQDVLLLLVPILLLLLIMLASRMIDKILLPINKLIQVINSTSVSEFSQNIVLPQEHDELRELVVSFNNIIERLREGVEILDRFNSDVSHELKTPLTVIQGEIEITLRKLREPKVYKKSMQTIFEQSKQIESIVEQLLLLTKYSKDNIKESFELCNLDSILLACIDNYDEQLKAKNLHLEIRRLEVILLNANPILMNSIFSNLLDNAIKYTPKGKNIYIELYQSDKIVFSVKDEGIGIAKEQLNKVTDRFYRVDESRHIKGFGLGLSIVKNSVELHEGSLIFDSSLERGVHVTVFL